MITTLADAISDALDHDLTCKVVKDDRVAGELLDADPRSEGPWVAFRAPIHMSDPDDWVPMKGFCTKKEAEEFCRQMKKQFLVNLVLKNIAFVFEKQVASTPPL